MIGVFDSGIGGLTIVRALRKKLPRAHILYVGDVARTPYGNKSPATVIEYSREITRYLVARGARVIVIACNSASAVATDTLRKEFRLPIIDVITPAVRVAFMRGQGAGGKGQGRRIAVLGTRATINSGAYQRALAPVKITTLACPLFVPLVEEGFVDTLEGEAIVHRTLAPLRNKKIDTAILGCTHYPLLAHAIARALPGVRLIDSSAVADDVAVLLAREPHIARGAGALLEIRVTDRTEHFDRFAKKIIGANVTLKTISVDSF